MKKVLSRVPILLLIIPFALVLLVSIWSDDLLILGLFLFPWVLTALNFALLFIPAKKPWIKRFGAQNELLTIAGGTAILLLFELPWDWFSFLPTVAELLCWAAIFLAIAAWVPLRFYKLSRRLKGICIAIISIGFLPCVVLCVWMLTQERFGDFFWLYFFLPPLNCILIGVKAIRDGVSP